MQNEITEALCDLHQKLLTKLTDKQHVYVFNGGEIRKMADLVLDAAIECGRIAALAAARPTPSVDTEARTLALEEAITAVEAEMALAKENGAMPQVLGLSWALKAIRALTQKDKADA